MRRLWRLFFPFFLALHFIDISQSVSARNARAVCPRLSIVSRRPTTIPAMTMAATSTTAASVRPMGVFNAIGASSKFVVSTLAAVVLFSTESWSSMFYILAAVANGVLSKLVKNTLKIPRPSGSGKNGYGMPSSHAQSFFFFLTVLATHRRRVFGDSTPDGLGVAACVAIAGYAVVASYWRVATRLHTGAQTVAGAVLGTLVALGAARAEGLGVRALRGIFGDADDAALVAKACITIAAAAVICKREISAVLQGLKSRPGT